MFPTLFRGPGRGVAGLLFCQDKSEAPEDIHAVAFATLDVAKGIIKPFHILQILR